ncbi:hypothetical protein BAUCODRAFT_123455 [Baudoinia panamericana UAMH 10762]|uniref:Uncharacterized protein n=1 Tax=Baudoinia panamericana (strain UAMH 10762) TaxID=717646 RepID=M2LL08_BAUPA|nr:uncharacterized protein BAUCODRAFT_123455 [Baudoinia panamericana UAMH 10762]EMC94967.1 hypothetical protein BAUCODRAFT_123455 [Baudoinia panamericana UAMH 10762]
MHEPKAIAQLSSSQHASRKLVQDLKASGLQQEGKFSRPHQCARQRGRVFAIVAGAGVLVQMEIAVRVVE